MGRGVRPHRVSVCVPVFLAWLAAGVAASVALTNWSTRLVLLLVPAVLVGAALLWLVGITRGAAAFLLGSAAGPLIVAGRDRACPTSADELTVCADHPAAVVLLVGLSVLMLAAGVGLLLRRPAPGA